MAQNVGIVASECYFPQTYVSQADMENFDGIPSGKYQIGLGQKNMAYVGPQEDINSMMLSALTRLMENYDLDYKDIGRLEVGTESIVDKSKSHKTTLMSLFQESGNSDVLGITNINACYGGTAALFNTVDWMSSPSWDGRYGVVLAGDIAVYERGPARPTGGAGVVALLIGPDAPLVLEPIRSSHFEDAYDFYKPVLTSEYPAVDGPLSNTCYLRALDNCYQGFTRKFKERFGQDFNVFGEGETARACLFHHPYEKLVQKSFGRVLYNDVKAGVTVDPAFEALAEFKDVPVDESYANRALEKAFATAAKPAYGEKVAPFTYAGQNLGNSYTGSLYFALLSLIANSATEDFTNDRVLMFSYGSGLASTMFSVKVEGDLTKQRETCNLFDRLDNQRVKSTPEEYTEALLQRENYYHKHDFEFAEPTTQIFNGAYRLTSVDSMGRRNYARQFSNTPKRAFSTSSARGLIRMVLRR